MVDSVPSLTGQQRSIKQVVKPILQAARAPDNRAFQQQQLNSLARASAPLPIVQVSGALPMEGQSAIDPRRSDKPTYAPQKPNSYKQPPSQKEEQREHWQSVPQSSETSVTLSEPLSVMIQRIAKPVTVKEITNTIAQPTEQPTKRTTQPQNTQNIPKNQPRETSVNSTTDQSQEKQDANRPEVATQRQEKAAQRQPTNDAARQPDSKQSQPHQRITQAAIRAQGRARDIVMNVNYAVAISMHSKRQRLMQHVATQESVSNSKQTQLQQTI
ncbi:MAG: hypothetical protein CENE_01126 [Candidatus Celerinatantimonas neptuna]|nr:MAG: hypothetical protein CENE_01126 [Candidatus Celerinatantimonas neptuna]